MSIFQSTCPHCGQSLDLQDNWVGMEVTCPYCNKTFTVKKNPDSEPKKLQISKKPGFSHDKESAPQEESTSNRNQSFKDIKQILLDKTISPCFILLSVSWLIYWTRGLWNAIYTNMSLFIPLISIILVFVLLDRSLKLMKAMKGIKNITFGLAILFIVLAVVSCIFFVSSPIHQAVPTAGKLEQLVKGQRVAKFLSFYSVTDQQSTISDATFSKKSFFDYTGQLTIRRKGKEYHRKVCVNCKLFNGKFKPFFQLDADYKNPKLLQEDSVLFLDIEFNSKKHPQLEDAKAISVRGDEARKNNLIYTIDLYGEETEVEVDVYDIKPNNSLKSEDVAKKQPETPSQSAEQSANLKVKTKTQIVEDSTRVTIEKEATVDIKQKQKQAPKPAVVIEEAPRVIKKGRAKLLATVSVWRNKIWYYEMGKKLLEGNGVPRNDKKGFIYLQKSLKLKYYKAAFELAKCYINGFGTPSNRTEAFNIIKKLADMGNIDARLQLSDYYFQGIGTATNEEEGFKILKELAKENNVQAKVRIALCYWQGIVVKKNETRAFNEIHEAAKENNPEALYYLALFYLSGIGTKEGQTTEAYDNFCEAAKNGHQRANIWVSYLRWNAIGTERNMEAAKNDLQNMASKGIAEAQLTLAYNSLTKDFVIDKIKNWRNVSDDENVAVPWLKKAADQGNAQAQLDLGCCYALGIGIEKNEHMMKKWWKNAIRTDVRMVMKLVDLLDKGGLPNDVEYEKGKGKGINKEIAAEWLSFAAEELNDPDAQIELARRYMHGEGVERDMEKAKELIENAVRINPAKGYKVARYYEEGGTKFKQDSRLAVYWMNKTAGKGVVLAMLGFAEYYEKGFGVTKNVQTAFNWIKRAAKAGDSFSQCLLGKCYLQGFGTTVNRNQARNWFEKAAKQKEGEAMYLIAEHLCDNKNEKFKWLKKSAETNYYKAQLLLARCYEKGVGVEMNKKQAFNWMLRASKQSLTEVGTEIGEAQLALAEYYKTGFGVGKDNGKEFYWIAEASNAGYARAQTMLATEYWNGTRIEEDRNRSLSLIGKAIIQGYQEAGDWIVEKSKDIEFDHAWRLIQIAAWKGNAEAWKWIREKADEENESVWTWLKLIAEFKDSNNWRLLWNAVAWDNTEKNRHRAEDSEKKAREAFKNNLHNIILGYYQNKNSRKQKRASNRTSVWQQSWKKEGSDTAKIKTMFSDWLQTLETAIGPDKSIDRKEILSFVSSAKPQAYSCIKSAALNGRKIAWKWIEEQAQQGNQTVWNFIVDIGFGHNREAREAAVKENNKLFEPVKTAEIAKRYAGSSIESFWTGDDILRYVMDSADKGNNTAKNIIKDIPDEFLKKARNIDEKNWNRLIKRIAVLKYASPGRVKSKSAAKIAGWANEGKQFDNENAQKLLCYIPLEQLKKFDAEEWEIIQRISKRENASAYFKDFDLETLEKRKNEPLWHWVESDPRTQHMLEGITVNKPSPADLNILKKMEEGNVTAEANVRKNVWGWIWKEVWKNLAEKTKNGKDSIVWGWITKEAENDNWYAWELILKGIDADTQKAWMCVQTISDNGKISPWEKIFKTGQQNKHYRALEYFKKEVEAGNQKALEYVFQEARAGKTDCLNIIKEIAKNDLQRQTEIFAWPLLMKLADSNSSSAWEWIFQKAQDKNFSIANDKIWQYLEHKIENGNQMVLKKVQKILMDKQPNENAWFCFIWLALNNNKKIWEFIEDNYDSNYPISRALWEIGLRTMTNGQSVFVWNWILNKASGSRERGYEYAKKLIWDWVYKKNHFSAWKCIELMIQKHGNSEYLEDLYSLIQGKPKKGYNLNDAIINKGKSTFVSVAKKNDMAFNKLKELASSSENRYKIKKWAWYSIGSLATKDGHKKSIIWLQKQYSDVVVRENNVARDWARTIDGNSFLERSNLNEKIF